MLLVLDDGIDQKERKAALVGAGLGEQRHIGGRRAERRPRSLFIGKTPREVIRWPAGPFEHFAGIDWAVLDLVCGGERLDLRFRKPGAAGIRQIAERDQFEGMTIGTNLTVDLKPPLKLRLIVAAEGAVKAPFLTRRIGLLLLFDGPRPGLREHLGSARGYSRHQNRAEGQSNTAADPAPHRF